MMKIFIHTYMAHSPHDDDDDDDEEYDDDNALTPFKRGHTLHV